MATRVDFLIGCTASGKGAVGLEVARQLGAEILSIDSMKVYRRMDIGTAKPSPERRAAVPHHLLDVVEPSEVFSVARFVEHAGAAIDEITGRGRRVLAVGGTALYLKGLIDGLFEGPSADPEIRREIRARAEREGNEALHAELAAVDPESAARIHRNDMRRIERALEVYRLTGSPISALQTQWDCERTRYDCHIVGLRRDKDDHSRRSNARIKRMIEAGLVDEVRGLLAEPVPMSDQARQALGYAEIIDHLQGDVSLTDAIEAIKIHTRQFAKHQRTWFRRFRQARWVDLAEDDAVDAAVLRVREALERPEESL